MPTDDTHQLMTRREAAAHIGVNTIYLANAAKRKTGPDYYRPTPRRTLYRKADLDAWLDQSRVPGRG